jgi:secondary thiamine-phosphate synthase enzyme
MQEELIDITEQINGFIKKSDFKEGLCCVYTPHTTAAVTINENADPAVKRDILAGLRALNLETVPYQHSEGNSAAHLKSSLIGASEMVIIRNGSLLLGTWQGVYFCEFDGPRERNVYVTFINSVK